MEGVHAHEVDVSWMAHGPAKVLLHLNILYPLLSFQSITIVWTLASRYIRIRLLEIIINMATCNRQSGKVINLYLYQDKNYPSGVSPTPPAHRYTSSSNHDDGDINNYRGFCTAKVSQPATRVSNQQRHCSKRWRDGR
ncbi:hypothetical protein SAPIO_CDS10714 [Scedosporium apiospermum]|uniref:Uncharacterized protein n=1 Tax=Pseudallescheria apiosperma TaxID=563466 RepID=A0A084FUD1_PSEDA|nr:uncharacterized protein SAPIO_CDS10714 [Scedosporium apiospermum]KEZ38693.1 hypothetical protein SAPIO_CDS10714 [Scedosporium apiospermum]